MSILVIVDDLYRFEKQYFCTNVLSKTENIDILTKYIEYSGNHQNIKIIKNEFPDSIITKLIIFLRQRSITRLIKRKTNIGCYNLNLKCIFKKIFFDFNLMLSVENLLKYSCIFNKFDTSKYTKIFYFSDTFANYDLLSKSSSSKSQICCLVYSWDNIYQDKYFPSYSCYFFWSDIIRERFFTHFKFQRQLSFVSGSIQRLIINQYKPNQKSISSDKKYRIFFACSSHDRKYYFEEIKFVILVSNLLISLGFDFIFYFKPYYTEVDFLSDFNILKNYNIVIYEDHLDCITYNSNKTHVYNVSQFHKRLQFINDCDLYINIGTTMILEVAHLNTPILQIHKDFFLTNKNLCNLYEWVNVEHLDLIFNDSLSCIKSYSSLKATLLGFLQNDSSLLQDNLLYKNYLKKILGESITL